MRHVIIIGSGPAGYTAAIYAARANLEPLVVASSVEAGGELMTTTDVENFPGFPDGIQGPDLMTKMQEQAERFGAEVLYDDVVVARPRRTGQDGRSSAAARCTRRRSIVYATGSAHRKIGIEGEERLSGRGVSYCATCDGFFFRDRVIAVVGGGDSAMEEATFLTQVRVEGLRHPPPRRAARLEDHAGARVREREDRVRLEQRGRRHPRRGCRHRRRARVDGRRHATRPRRSTACSSRSATTRAPTSSTASSTSRPRAPIWVDGRSSRTSVPGVFAAGDVIDPTYRQAVTAAGSGTVAALDVEHFLAALGEAGAPDVARRPDREPRRSRRRLSRSAPRSESRAEQSARVARSDNCETSPRRRRQ